MTRITITIQDIPGSDRTSVGLICDHDEHPTLNEASMGRNLRDVLAYAITQMVDPKEVVTRSCFDQPSKEMLKALRKKFRADEQLE